jgi:MFS family permease
MAGLFRNGTMRFALVALAIGQIMMVIIMVITPIHIRDAGGSLGAVGAVISAHTIGMFAVSPISGRLSDRIGAGRVVLAGLGLLLVASLGASLAAGDAQALLIVSLFFLGLGWNLEFVGGSALVVEIAPASQRLQVQGIADSIVWMSAAVAGVASGVVLAIGGFTLVSLLGAALVVIPGAAWLARGVQSPESRVLSPES